MEETGQPFEAALAVTRAGNLFTTHTAVAAGFDRFAPGPHRAIPWRVCRREARHFTVTICWPSAARTRTIRRSLSTWRIWPCAGSGAANGVSRLHGKVSRRLFLPLFPRWPEDEVPVGHVTNGVHMPTWDSARRPTIFGRKAVARIAGWGRRRPWNRTFAGSPTKGCGNFAPTPASRWSSTLANGCRCELAAAGAPPRTVEAAKHLFDPNALTLGFARRFATYKRPNLLLHDPARLLRLLTNPQRPVQLIIAGKAHPADLRARP